MKFYCKDMQIIKLYKGRHTVLSTNVIKWKPSARKKKQKKKKKPELKNAGTEGGALLEVNKLQI